MSHTPGPWTVDEYGHIAAPGGEIVVVNGTKWAQVSGAPERAEYAANTRLVAAAPELLEALRLVAASADHHEACFSDELDMALGPTVIKQVRDAIAKATSSGE